MKVEVYYNLHKKKFSVRHNGKVIAQYTPSNLVQNINAKNAYFGDNFKFN